MATKIFVTRNLQDVRPDFWKPLPMQCLSSLISKVFHEPTRRRTPPAIRTFRFIDNAFSILRN